MVHLMDDDLEEVLITKEQIETRLRELAIQISADYRDKSPVIVCILKGAVLFFVDLVKRLPIFLELDFIAASSYGEGHESSGSITIKHDLSVDIRGRHVILVEDIVDTGLTMTQLKAKLGLRSPASIAVVALCNKEARRTQVFHPDYVGFEIEDKFIVGMGLDGPNGRYRNLPYVGVLQPRCYAEANQ
jgi:hypoxanthine phosphoribosyltransferase